MGTVTQRTNRGARIGVSYRPYMDEAFIFPEKNSVPTHSHIKMHKK